MVSSPHFALCDLALALVVRHSRKLVCFHVNAAYWYNAAESRLAYFQALRDAGRLQLLEHLPLGPLGRRCIWILVFANKELKAQLLRGSSSMDWRS